MNRREIKEKAKEMIKGNKWLILKPIAFIWLISFAVGFICGFMGLNADITSLITDICSLVTGILGSAYYAYLLKFVRTGTANINDVIECFKEKWLKIFIASILVAIFTFLWSLLFIIPGIIASYAYTWAIVLVIDKDIEPKEAIKPNSENLMSWVDTLNATIPLSLSKLIISITVIEATTLKFRSSLLVTLG